MLLIQAIKYLIDQLESSLKGRMNPNGSSDMQIALRLKAAPSNDGLGPILQAAAPKDDISEELLRQLAALELVEINEEKFLAKHGIVVENLSLPPASILKKPNSALLRQVVPSIDKGTDDTILHFGITFSQLVTSTKAEFEGRLKTTLAKEDLTFNKMCILARFKRQLLLLSEYATQVLIEREKVFNVSKGAMTFNDSVDVWLKMMINECATEALELCQMVLRDAKVSLGALSIEKGEGETEGMIKICKQVVEEFVTFCQKANEQDHIAKTEQRSMVDLFPNKTQQQQALRAINEEAAQDLVERLVKIATYQHYPKASWYYSAWNPVGFSLATANDKCSELANALHAFEEQAKRYKDETAQYWKDMIDRTHESYNQATHHITRFSLYSQRSTQMWVEAHKKLVALAPFLAKDVVDPHRSCFKG